MTTIEPSLLSAAFLFLLLAAAAGFLRLYTPRLLRGWPLLIFALFALLETLLSLAQGGLLLLDEPSRLALGLTACAALFLTGWGMGWPEDAPSSKGMVAILAGWLMLSAWLPHLPGLRPGLRLAARLLPLPVGGWYLYALYRYTSQMADLQVEPPKGYWLGAGSAALLWAMAPAAGIRWPALYGCGWLLSAWLWLLSLIGLSYRQQRHMMRWLSEVERAQIIAVDRERISRELHDGVIQSIYAAGLMLEGAKYEMDKDPARAMAHLDQVTEALDTTIRDIRRYIFDLRGEVSGEELVPSLRRLLQEFEANTYLKTHLNVIGEAAGPLQRERQQHLYQIVREALSNVARHAHANGVALTVIYSDEGVDIHLADDGVGMERIPLHKGYGLRNIRERVRLLDGTMKIESAPGKGVTLHISIPYG